MTQVLYACDNEDTTILDLKDLLVWATPKEVDDVNDALKERGWYQGQHENGQFLILSLDKFMSFVRPAPYWR